MDKIPEVKIEWKALAEIKPYQANAKEHPTKQIKQIAESIKAFGFLVPIVIDGQGEIIAGHGRYLAAQTLEQSKVPTIQADHLNDEQIKAYRLADNKLNESKWDMGLVVDELKGLSMPMIDLTGFSRDLVIENEDQDDVIPDGPDKTRSKLGDIYQLGRHKIICADSTKLETYQKLMAGESADMVFTDPPYNVNYKGRGKDTSRNIENDHMEEGLFDNFLLEFFKTSVEVVKEGGGLVYIPFVLHPRPI